MTDEMITPAEIIAELEKSGWRSVERATFERGGVVCYVPLKPIPRAEFGLWIAGADEWWLKQQRQEDPAFGLR